MILIKIIHTIKEKKNLVVTESQVKLNKSLKLSGEMGKN